MKNKMFRRVVCAAVALSLSVSCFVPTAFADTDDSLGTQDEGSEALTGTDSVRQTSYSKYLEKYQDTARPDIDEIVIKGSDYIPDSISDDLSLGTETSFEGVDDVLYWANQQGSVSYEVEVPQDGRYNLKMSYYALPGTTNDIEFSLLIDGESPYGTAQRITLDKVWINENDIGEDAKGNDMRPGQVEFPMWQMNKPIEDVDGLFNEPLQFYMSAGKHIITLESDKAQFVLGDITVYNYKEPKEYEAPSANDIGATRGQKLVLEGETATYKSSRTLYPTSDKTSYMTSSEKGYSPTKTRYNTIGGGNNWNQSTQAVTWEFNIPQSGYYKIGIFGRQDQMRGMYSNRRVLINGVVPNKESEQVKFYYDTDWSVVSPSNKAGNPMYYFMEAGKNTITLEAVPGEIGEIMGELDDVVFDINSYYRQIRQITGPSPDEYNNYMIDVAIPDIIGDFQYNAKLLRQEKEEIERLSGSGGTEAETLEKMAIVLDKCVKKPDIIPEMMGQIKDNITAVSTFINTYRMQPLEVDKIEVCTDDVSFSECSTTFFGTVGHGFQSFVGSFFEDYNSLSNDEDGTAQECWVTLGRDNAVVIKELIDSDYNANTNKKINLKLVQGGITEATFSGKGPDMALFLGGDYPIQLAVRDTLVDLTQFSDYDEVTQRFSPNMMTLYTYDDGVYGLPCTQNFPMLFYRTDILAEYGIDPEYDLVSWDRIINCLPTLQRNYLEVGLRLPATATAGVTMVSAVTENGNTFAMMLLQQGLNYYSDDLKRTTFGEQPAIEAFDTWTKFYTTYSFQQQYDAFTRFRQGDMPVLVNDYAFYNQLTAAAPEIKGCWSFRAVPGTFDENGNLNHAANSEGTCCVIFKKAPDYEGAWDFIKWFTSTDIQTKYGNNIESVLGPMGRYSTANQEALKGLSWSTKEADLLLDQMNSQVEIPIIPASYGVTRNIMNAFRKVVNENENARDTLFWYNKDINDEIARKRADLGLD
ncbi:extracellular solute-binding protein [uncultured Ruminococcus sp.]|uniref:extracellular solute-binding protein n=1 Tax=uncultured Ruminococcus sp. TaxID=165186 RepID=UPI0025F1A86A|nr:extracellular solute-binding protein [uncultured Ruminococcus sp.]